MMAFGFYRYYQGVDEQRELSREKQWARFYLEPLLTAEKDRNLARRYYSEMARRDMVRETMSPESRERFDEELYHDKSKFRFPKYHLGASPSEK